MLGSHKLNWLKYLLPLAIFAFSGFLLFYHLGNHPFIDWDEGIYAQVAKESFLSHNQADLSYFHQSWIEKPPLMTWVTEFGYSIFGINELGARFFVGLFGLLTIVLTYFFVFELTESFFSSVLAVTSYLICFHFFYASYFLQYDTAVGFFILLSLFGYLKTLKDSRYFYLLFSALALGVLTKSVIGLLPLPIIIFDLLFYKKYKELRVNKNFWYGLSLGAIILVPWHVIETVLQGSSFWNNYLLYHVFTRFGQPIENNGGSWNYYWAVIEQNKIFELLSICSLLAGLLLGIKKRAFGFLTFASIFIFIFFSLAKTKGYGYITVFYPYIVALIGLWLAEILNKSPWKMLKICTMVVLILIFSALGFQENQFKIFKWETDPFYKDNKAIAIFLNSNYPNTTIYSKSSSFTGPALFFYLGKTIPGWPANLPKPAFADLNSKTRIFHKTLRSVYNINGTLYLNY